MDKIRVKIFMDGPNEIPSYNKKSDSGFDIRADFSKVESEKDLLGNGKYSYECVDDIKGVLLEPGGRILIPSNIHVDIPDGYEIQVRPRSGLALKNGITIVNSPGTVDSGYLGNIGVILLNTDFDNSFFISDKDRIAQGVLVDVKRCDWVKVNSIDELGDTERGQTGFGDSGVK